jgi:hypothetical protein
VGAPEAALLLAVLRRPEGQQGSHSRSGKPVVPLVVPVAATVLLVLAP